MSVNTTDDCTVIREVLSGRTEAFRLLVERYFATVRLVALAKTGNVADAEDVAQETFIKAYETLGVLRNRERLAPWLVAIARNLAVSLVRRRERERRHAETHPIDPLIHPDHERRETLDAVARQVDALPENLREVVLLHYFEGLKCREIGERLDLNTNAVVKRLARGRDLLGDRLLREWAGERQQAAPSVHRVMGAIAALPRPDWTAQTAAMGGAAAGAKAGGLAAAIFGPPVAIKLIASVAVVALGALYFALNASDGVRDTTAASESTATVEEKSVVAAAKAGMGELIERTFGEAEDGPVSIEIPPPPPMVEVGFVSGVVVDVDGVPVRDAIVWARGRQNSDKATTNPNGDFRINVSAPVPAIESGDVSKYVTLSCSMPGFVPRTVEGVRLGTADVQVVLMRPAVLSGRVVDAETGAPVQEFSLRIDGPYRNPDTDNSISQQSKDFRSEEGEFRLEAGYGIERLVAQATGHTRSILDIGLGQGQSRDDLIITLDRGGEIYGVVLDEATGEPVPARISAKVPGREGLFFSGAATDNDGGFTLVGLPRDEAVTLVVDANGFTREIVPEVVPSAGKEIRIVLGRGGTVRGRVIYHGGPPPGSDKARIEEGYCQVDLVQYSEGLREQRQGFVRPDGTYEVSGLRTGLYRAQAFYWPSGKGNEGYSVSKLIHVREGEVRTLDIDYDERGGRISATVEGDSAFDAVVELRSMVDEMTVLESWVPVRSHPLEFGRRQDFAQLEPGDYVVLVYHPEDENNVLEERVRVVAGQTVKVHFDIGIVEAAADGEEPDTAPEEDATEAPANLGTDSNSPLP